MTEYSGAPCGCPSKTSVIAAMASSWYCWLASNCSFMVAPSDSLEAGDALGPEGLYGVRLQLVITDKALVQTDNSLRLHLGNRVDQVQSEGAFQADHQCAACD